MHCMVPRFPWLAQPLPCHVHYCMFCLIEYANYIPTATRCASCSMTCMRVPVLRTDASLIIPPHAVGAILACNPAAGGNQCDCCWGWSAWTRSLSPRTLQFAPHSWTGKVGQPFTNCHLSSCTAELIVFSSYCGLFETRACLVVPGAAGRVAGGSGRTIPKHRSTACIGTAPSGSTTAAGGICRRRLDAGVFGAAQRSNAGRFASNPGARVARCT